MSRARATAWFVAGYFAGWASALAYLWIVIEAGR